MTFTPRFAVEAIDAWFSSIHSFFGKILVLCVSGTIGNLVGTIFSLHIADSSHDAAFLLFYPYALLMNLFDPLGLLVGFCFFVFLVATTVFDLRLIHAFGILPPLQALCSFILGPSTSVAAFLLLAVFCFGWIFVYLTQVCFPHFNGNRPFQN